MKQEKDNDEDWIKLGVIKHRIQKAKEDMIEDLRFHLFEIKNSIIFRSEEDIIESITNIVNKRFKQQFGDLANGK